MSSFHITWRPSGGRGEYEYSPIDAAYENKPITLAVPVGGTMHRIVTDTHLEKNAGKRRLRRANSTDRVRLSVPNLVAALAALPKPTRDRDNIATPSLSAGRWALGAAELEILSKATDSKLVVRPLAIQPRHFDSPIDVAERMKALEAEAALPGPLGEEAGKHLAAVTAGVNDVTLERSAQAVFDAFSDANADMPLLATPEEVEVVHALEKADEAALPATGTEGKKRVVAHALRERDKGLVKKKEDRLSIKARRRSVLRVLRSYAQKNVRP
ncbi:hypothetical protein ACQUZK_09125 [Streptococcus pyogenes]|uniref:hypothetical protein n=1 Tax=Streptococcus pyogenes TaxID=1314 RepID=UPI003DA0E736